jgi:hypothetical protein
MRSGVELATRSQINTEHLTGGSVITVKVSQDIGYPVVYVFRKFIDIEHAATGAAGIKKIEMLTPGDLRLGTRWRETREVMGWMDDAEMELTAFERNRMYRITHQKAGFRIDTTVSFEPIHGGTQVTVEFDLSSGGVPPGLTEPLGWAVHSKVADALSQDLSDLKYAIEHGHVVNVLNTV